MKLIVFTVYIPSGGEVYTALTLSLAPTPRQPTHRTKLTTITHPNPPPLVLNSLNPFRAISTPNPTSAFVEFSVRGQRVDHLPTHHTSSAMCPPNLSSISPEQQQQTSSVSVSILNTVSLVFTTKSTPTSFQSGLV